MPTPIILSVIADRSSWPLNSWCTSGVKRKSQVNKITWLLVLVSGWQLFLDCLHVKHVGGSLAARVEFTLPPFSRWSAHVCSATNEVKGQGSCNYTGECERRGDISPILTLWVQIFSDLHIFLPLYVSKAMLPRGSTIRYTSIRQPVCWSHTTICVSAGGLGPKTWARAVKSLSSISPCLVIGLIWSHCVSRSMFSSLMANANTESLCLGGPPEGLPNH